MGDKIDTDSKIRHGLCTLRNAYAATMVLLLSVGLFCGFMTAQGPGFGIAHRDHIQNIALTLEQSPLSVPGKGLSNAQLRNEARALLSSVLDTIEGPLAQLFASNDALSERSFQLRTRLEQGLIKTHSDLGWTANDTVAELNAVISIIRDSLFLAAVQVEQNSRRTRLYGVALIVSLTLSVALTLGVSMILPARRSIEDTVSKLQEQISTIQSSIEYDTNTGLPTRHLLLAQLQQDHRDQKTLAPLAILHFDINRLKDINDTFGREVGDLCIEHFAKTLAQSRSPTDRVARVSADEFILASCCRQDELSALADGVKERIEAPTVIDGRMISMTCSVGIAHGPGADPEALLFDADLALDDAKKKGLGAISLYSDGMREVLQSRRGLAEALKLAVQNDEIEPFFQPQIDARTGDVVGFEALVRWRRPNSGIMMPAQFLAIAEDTNLIGPISRIMLKKSLMLLHKWRNMGLSVPQVSVNFTATDLREPDFVESLLFDVDRADLLPSDLCVELLESAMIEDENDPVIKTLSALTKHGFSVELDDFGTGHASISNLHRIKVTGMKIDRSFVIRLHENPEQQKLTRAMLSLAKTLEICSLAEGVECEAERRLLVEMGCERLQGFGIARPMSATDATAWLELYQHDKIDLLLRSNIG